MRHLFVLALLVLGAPASGQVVVRVAAGVDANHLGDMRALQEEVVTFARTSLGVPAEETDAFPPYLSLRAGLVLPLDRDVALGLEAGSSSAGGRVDYQDRTGRYRHDLVLSRLFVGAFAEWALGRQGPVDVAAAFRTRWSLSFLDLEETLVVEGQTLTARTLEGTQSGVGVQPELSAGVAVGGPIRFRGHLGWEQVLRTEALRLGEDGTSREAIDWSGWRLGAGLSVAL